MSDTPSASRIVLDALRALGTASPKEIEVWYEAQTGAGPTQADGTFRNALSTMALRGDVWSVRKHYPEIFRDYTHGAYCLPHFLDSVGSAEAPSSEEQGADDAETPLDEGDKPPPGRDELRDGYRRARAGRTVPERPYLVYDGQRFPVPFYMIEEDEDGTPIIGHASFAVQLGPARRMVRPINPAS